MDRASLPAHPSPRGEKPEPARLELVPHTPVEAAADGHQPCVRIQQRLRLELEPIGDGSVMRSLGHLIAMSVGPVRPER
jgi:hypothetical protein